MADWSFGAMGRSRHEGTETRLTKEQVLEGLILKVQSVDRLAAETSIAFTTAPPPVPPPQFKMNRTPSLKPSAHGIWDLFDREKAQGASVDLPIYMEGRKEELERLKVYAKGKKDECEGLRKCIGFKETEGLNNALQEIAALKGYIHFLHDELATKDKALSNIHDATRDLESREATLEGQVNDLKEKKKAIKSREEVVQGRERHLQDHIKEVVVSGQQLHTKLGRDLPEDLRPLLEFWQRDRRVLGDHMSVQEEAQSVKEEKRLVFLMREALVKERSEFELDKQAEKERQQKAKDEEFTREYKLTMFRGWEESGFEKGFSAGEVKGFSKGFQYAKEGKGAYETPTDEKVFTVNDFHQQVESRAQDQAKKLVKAMTLKDFESLRSQKEPEAPSDLVVEPSSRHNRRMKEAAEQWHVMKGKTETVGDWNRPIPPSDSAYRW